MRQSWHSQGSGQASLSRNCSIPAKESHNIALEALDFPRLWNVHVAGFGGNMDRTTVEPAIRAILGEIRRLCEIASPETSIVMSVGPTHLSRLGSMPCTGG